MYSLGFLIVFFILNLEVSTVDTRSLVQSFIYRVNPRHIQKTMTNVFERALIELSDESLTLIANTNGEIK